MRIGVRAFRAGNNLLRIAAFALHFRAKREQPTGFYRLLPESQGQNLALDVVYVPCSLDGGKVSPMYYTAWLVLGYVPQIYYTWRTAPANRCAEREFFIDNLLVRIRFIIVMIRWTGLAPREFEFPFPGSLTATFLHRCVYRQSRCSRRTRAPRKSHFWRSRVPPKLNLVYPMYVRVNP